MEIRIDDSKKGTNVSETELNQIEYNKKEKNWIKRFLQVI